RLLGHYRRVCGVSGLCNEATDTTARRTKMTAEKVRTTRRELRDLGYINMVEHPAKPCDITLIDRMAENVTRYQDKGLPKTGVLKSGDKEEPEIKEEPISDSSLRSESGAHPSDALGPELDDIHSKALDNYKQQQAITALSNPGTGEPITSPAPPAAPVPPASPILTEARQGLPDGYEWWHFIFTTLRPGNHVAEIGAKKTLCGETTRDCHYSRSDQGDDCHVCQTALFDQTKTKPGMGLYTPGEVQVRRGRVSIAGADGNMRPAKSEFYVILPDIAIGPFKALGKELSKVVQETGGRVSSGGPEGRAVQAPPGKAKKPKAPRPRNALLDALASLCYGDADAAMKMRGVPARLNKALGEIKAAAPDVTADRIPALGAWWYQNDWRGQKGQRPEPQQLPDAWLKFMNGDVVNGSNGNRNLDDDAVRRSPDFDWGYPESGMPVMSGNGNAHGSAAPQVEPGPERGVPGAGGNSDPA
ncbi:MAG TPA: hypothetical protein VJ325_05330, partial [Thiobacillus sp.]|nr:hypothetical protein [Thiobacillus sp.]